MAAAIKAVQPARAGRWRAWARMVLALAFALVGLIHLKSPDGFLPIMPAWVPAPRLVVILTGVCELFGAAGLLLPPTRRLAGIMLATYAVCVFPANIKHAVDHVAVGGVVLGPWYHVPRLLFQPVIVWWSLFAGEVVDWPFASTRRRASRVLD